MFSIFLVYVIGVSTGENPLGDRYTRLTNKNVYDVIGPGYKERHLY